jgi:hypothetical protein
MSITAPHLVSSCLSNVNEGVSSLRGCRTRFRGASDERQPGDQKPLLLTVCRNHFAHLLMQVTSRALIA